MKFFDVQTSFYRPLWLRIILTGVCLGWAIFELSTGAAFWGVLFGAVGVFLAWQFFVVFDPKDDERSEKR